MIGCFCILSVFVGNKYNSDKTLFIMIFDDKINILCALNQTTSYELPHGDGDCGCDILIVHDSMHCRDSSEPVR